MVEVLSQEDLCIGEVIPIMGSALRFCHRPMSSHYVAPLWRLSFTLVSRPGVTGAGEDEEEKKPTAFVSL
jgi:hypothetical protein